MLYKLKLFFYELCKEMNQIRVFLGKKEEDSLFYLTKLARCCHILDKGCYTVPFEKNHSLGIYEEAKEYLSKIEPDLYKDDSCYLWCVERIKRYEALQKEGTESTPVYFNPTIYKDSKEYDGFIESFISVRRFCEDIIPNDIINKCISVAQSASSSCFRQTPRCYAIKSKEMINELTKNIAGLTGFSNGVPLLICITSDIRAYDCIDRNLAYIDATLFSQNLVLSLRNKNIFSVFLNFQQATKSDINSVRKILKIPEYEKVIIFIACGYSNFISEKPKRLNLEKVGKIYE